MLCTVLGLAFGFSTDHVGLDGVVAIVVYIVRPNMNHFHTIWTVDLVMYFLVFWGWVTGATRLDLVRPALFTVTPVSPQQRA